MKKVLIIGKGWLGNRLENSLNNLDEIKITTTKRNSDTENCIAVNFDEEVNQQISSNEFNLIIITVPFGKRTSVDELNFRFNQLIKFIGNYTQQLIVISSTGIYPENGLPISENTFLEEDLNQPYQFIESKLKSNYPQLTILRLGGLMGDDRYLSKYVQLTGNNLNQVVNHTHYKDVCNLIEVILKENTHGKLYNVVAPEHPTREEVLNYQIHGKIVKSDDKVGKIISSDLLLKNLNYQFIHPNPLYFKE